MKTVNAQQLTALILTYNEEVNIGRVLDQLTWLERVVVLDSHSTDATVTLAKRYPNVELYYRKFDAHATQWNYGLSLIHSRWVLTLDADYVLTPAFISETQRIIERDDKVGYTSRFRFVVFGKPLLRNNTTPRVVLFRRDHGRFYQDGHTQRLAVAGEIGSYRSYILHDDRKSLSRWLLNLDKYSVKECMKMMDTSSQHPNSLILRIRKTRIWAPFLVFFYCLFVNGALLDGWRGWHYTLQRTLVEILFALRLIEEQKLKRLSDNAGTPMTDTTIQRHASRTASIEANA